VLRHPDLQSPAVADVEGGSEGAGVVPVERTAGVVADVQRCTSMSVTSVVQRKCVPASPAADEVLVFWADLDVGEQAAWRLADVLDAHERVRAARFHFRRDAIRFTAARAMLRRLLAGAVGAEPGELSFAYGPYGKPELSSPFAASGLQFNVSHSEGVGVFALVRGCRVGIDVERVRSLADLDAVAERTFSPREWAELRRLPSMDRELAFFRCWTRKESFIKALGEGLSHPLDRFSVTVQAEEPARLIETDVEGEAGRWTLESLDPPTGFVGALALEGASLRMVVGRAEAAV
jgi:4'-phosphopantetheinyl transferase